MVDDRINSGLNSDDEMNRLKIR